VEADVDAGRFDRTRCGGLITAAGEVDGRPVAIAWSDFRVNAAAYGQANSRRFTAFLRHLRTIGKRVPLIYVVNSAGLSLAEGRQLFADAFAIWPELLRYAEERQLLTCAAGRCLGLAPILFGLGHYRVAIAERTQLNLAGPDVITRFFGKGTDFERGAAAERFVEQNDLIHELVPSVDAAFARFREILSLRPAHRFGPSTLGGTSAMLLHSFLDCEPGELIPGWSDRLRIFLGTRRGSPIGIFLNPPERSNNLICVRTLDKYAAGLDLFRSMRIPIVSLLDSPGADPRFDQSDANNFRRMLWVGEKIIRYPHGAMGVVIGRCFGGAATLGFPKVFGGTRSLALTGCRVGTMDSRLIDGQLSGSARLRAEWKATAARQGPELGDLLERGTVDAVIEVADLAREVDTFLAQVRRPRLVDGAAAARMVAL
jgi:acetyl-CoA carboxylase carboxyltransferase component